MLASLSASICETHSGFGASHHWLVLSPDVVLLFPFPPTPIPLCSWPYPSPLCATLTADSRPYRHQQSGVPAFPGGPSMQGHPHLRGAQQTRPVELSSYGDGLVWGAGMLMHLLNQTAWFKLTDLSSLVVQRQQLEYKGTGGCRHRALLVLCKADACVSYCCCD